MLSRLLDAPLPRRTGRSLSRPSRQPGAFRAGGRLARAARRITEAHLDARSHEKIAPDLRTRRLVYGLSRIFSDLCEVHGIRPRVSGPVPRGPVILVANHVSYIDALVLAGIVPAMPISKVEVGSWPLIGGVARRYGVTFVDRGNATSGAKALLRARTALESGLSVLNFPEGTTTRGESVLPFKRGVFGLAQRMEVPIVPVALRLDDPDMCWVGDDPFLPHYMGALRRDQVGVGVRFGCPMTVGRYRSAEDLAEEARAMTEHLLCDA